MFIYNIKSITCQLKIQLYSPLHIAHMFIFYMDAVNRTLLKLAVI